MTSASQPSRKPLISKEASSVIGQVLFYLLIGVIFIYLLFPYYWAINSSLKTERELLQTPASFFPQNLTLQNYQAVFRNQAFLLGLRNSTIVAFITTFISLLIGSFTAYALGKLRFRGKSPALYVILAMTMFPQVAVLAGLYSVMLFLRPAFANILPAGIPTAIPGMILSYMIFTLPFTVWVLTSFFKELPGELMQAAQVDGATMMQTFWRVLLPLVLPGLVTTGLLAFINCWNEYLFALTFTSIEPAARTVPVAISLFSGLVSRQEPFGEIMAAAVVVTIPLIVLVLIFQNRIIEGLTAGGVKG